MKPTPREQRLLDEFFRWPAPMRGEVLRWMQGAVCGHASRLTLTPARKQSFRHWWKKVLAS